MRYRQSQTGFSAVELLIVIVVVAVLALVGYSVYQWQNNKPATTANTQSDSETMAGNVPSAPAINTSSDLDEASTTLDQMDISASNSSDSSQLDSQLAAF